MTGSILDSHDRRGAAVGWTGLEAGGICASYLPTHIPPLTIAKTLMTHADMVEEDWPAPRSRTALAWSDSVGGLSKSWMWTALAMQDIRLRYRGSGLKQ